MSPIRHIALPADHAIIAPVDRQGPSINAYAAVAGLSRSQLRAAKIGGTMGTLKRRLTPVAAAIAGSLFIGASPQTEISLCNDFHSKVFVALAYLDQGTFTARGWWSVDPHRCEPADFLFPGSTIYYTADSDDYKQDGKTMTDHWGNKTQLFVSNKKFNFDHAENPRDGASGESFSLIELSEKQQLRPVKITFHFTSGSTTTDIDMK
jgi:uncharacterized membrane protein